MNDDLALIRDAALAAGKVALDLRERGLETSWKPGNSPVTNGDLAVDALLKERLLAARPDYGWLSEETADNPGRLSNKRLFIVDPIDGTQAYVKGKPWFTVCIAVVEDGRPTVGVVFGPELEELYEAAAGEGASLNGRPIHASNRQALEGCSMLGDAKMFASPRWPTPWPAMGVETRNSVAYRMCLVASGAFDACFAPSNKHDWDVAAADLICTEAGALVTDHKGNSFRYNRPVPRQPALVCAGPALHALLLDRSRHIDLPH
jgi:myo-inositol-1(or 4)-monophosphatase